jgi:hypothetical protein
MPDTESSGVLTLETQITERYSLSYPCDHQTHALKACGRKIGRRVYYPAHAVAHIIIGNDAT